MFGSPLCGSTQTNKMGTKKYDRAAEDQLLFSANISFCPVGGDKKRRHVCCCCSLNNLAYIFSIHMMHHVSKAQTLSMYLCTCSKNNPLILKNGHVACGINWTDSQEKFSMSQVASEYCSVVPNMYHLFAIVWLLGPKFSWSGCTVGSNDTADNITITQSLISECRSLIRSHFSAQSL